MSLTTRASIPSAIIFVWSVTLITSCCTEPSEVSMTRVRALESCLAEDGRVHPTVGWTDLVLDQDTPVRAVDGILTGFHDPDASHLDLLEAIAPPELVADSYGTAAEAGYRRHEFGDLLLIAPRQGGGPVTGA